MLRSFIKKYVKDRVVLWAIKQIVLDGRSTYGGMDYLEDVTVNKWGEQQFIFRHKIVKITPGNLQVGDYLKTHESADNPTARAPRTDIQIGMDYVKTKYGLGFDQPWLKEDPP
jgi:hypothetical protein